MNYQVLKGMSLKLREDSLSFGRETIVTSLIAFELRA